MTRITIDMSMVDIVKTMSGGNPGALSVLVQVLKDAGSIDPDNALGSLGTILAMDTLGIYGSDIWVLYKDICDTDLATFLAVIRANQLGMLSAHAIKTAIAGSATIDTYKVLTEVRTVLPRFLR